MLGPGTRAETAQKVRYGRQEGRGQGGYRTTILGHLAAKAEIELVPDGGGGVLGDSFNYCRRIERKFW